MNYIDLIIIFLLIASAIGGLTKGLIYEVASLIALVAGVWGAIKFSGAVETFMVRYFHITYEHINIVAFFITFILISILVHFLAQAIEHAFNTVPIGPVNKVLGMVFATIKSAFIIGIILLFIEGIDKVIPVTPEKKIQEAKLYVPLRNLSINSLPYLKNFFEGVKEEVDPKDTASFN
jgi:membrane protein required for colicin V production